VQTARRNIENCYSIARRKEPRLAQCSQENDSLRRDMMNQHEIFGAWFQQVDGARKQNSKGCCDTIPLPKRRIIRQNSQMLGTTITSINISNEKERFP
jgi:hypothetical protein